VVLGRGKAGKQDERRRKSERPSGAAEHACFPYFSVPWMCLA
jgi:hypothetical protein